MKLTILFLTLLALPGLAAPGDLILQYDKIPSGFQEGRVTPVTGQTLVWNSAAPKRLVGFDLTAALTGKANLAGGNTFTGVQVFNDNVNFNGDVDGNFIGAFFGDATNLTGTAAGLTAGTVTTNADLTGHITSVGNATSLGSFTLAQLSTATSDANIARTDAGQTFAGDQVFSSTTRPTSAGTGTPAADSLVTRADGDTRYGAYQVMRNLADIDITAASLTPISGMSVSVEANSVYEMSGYLNVLAAGGAPTTNRIVFRVATTGTFVAGIALGPITNGGFFPTLPSTVASTSIVDVSNSDRAVPIFGTIITGTAGTFTLNGWKVQGSSTPKLLANSILILRKIQ